METRDKKKSILFAHFIHFVKEASIAIDRLRGGRPPFGKMREMSKPPFKKRK